MHILGFDTSSGIASVSVSRGEQIIGYRREMRRSMQAENLFMLIEGALSEAQCTLHDIDYLAVTVGPGSFTGVRIGLAAARGLVLAHPMKVFGITNFDLCFFRSCRQVVNVQHHVAIINAYRGQCYVQVMSAGVLQAPELLEKSQLVELMKSLNGRVAISGNYLQECYLDLMGLSEHDLILLPRFAEADAKNICRTVANKIVVNETYRGELIPLYIRKPDAKLPKQV